MAIPISSSTPYCTVAQFFARHDWRTIANWVSDTGIAESEGFLKGTDSNGFPTHPVLVELFGEASGIFEAAVMMGDRYNLTDLQIATTRSVQITDNKDPANPTLTFNTILQPGNTGKFIAALVADVVMYLVWDRRPNRNADIKVPAKCELAFVWLEKIRDGQRIFALQEQADAGIVDSFVETSSDVGTRNGTVVQARDYFGRRANQITALGQ
jgi:hypothetical protein